MRFCCVELGCEYVRYVHKARAGPVQPFRPGAVCSGWRATHAVLEFVQRWSPAVHMNQRDVWSIRGVMIEKAGGSFEVQCVVLLAMRCAGRHPVFLSCGPSSPILTYFCLCATV